MVDDSISFLIAGLMFGFIIGMIFITLAISTGETTGIRNSFLDDYCEMEYGEGFIYFDDTFFGVDQGIDCYKTETEFALSEVGE